ncbi:unnamed protein product [Rhodiola kirilowii]
MKIFRFTVRGQYNDEAKFGSETTDNKSILNENGIIGSLRDISSYEEFLEHLDGQLNIIEAELAILIRLSTLVLEREEMPQNSKICKSRLQAPVVAQVSGPRVRRSGRRLIQLGGGSRSSRGGLMRWRRTWWSGPIEVLWRFAFGTALIDLLQLLAEGQSFAHFRSSFLENHIMGFDIAQQTGLDGVDE